MDAWAAFLLVTELGVEKKVIVFCRRNCVTEIDKRVASSEGEIERDNSREREETAVQHKLQREGGCWFDCHFEKYLGQTPKSELSQSISRHKKK